MSQRKRILITGIPGMGKTTLAIIIDSNGFLHIEMETEENQHAFLHSNPRSFIESLGQEKDIVVSYGFNPLGCTIDVLFLKNEGFKVIWLDGNREAALREYKKREIKRDPTNLEHHIENFYAQIERINRTKVIQEIEPIQINTFDKNGEFIDSEKIVEKIITN